MIINTTIYNKKLTYTTQLYTTKNYKDAVKIDLYILNQYIYNKKLT